MNFWGYDYTCPLCRLRLSSDVLASARVAIELKSALGNSARGVLANSFKPDSGEPYSVRPSSAQAFVGTKLIAECAQRLWKTHRTTCVWNIRSARGKNANFVMGCYGRVTSSFFVVVYFVAIISFTPCIDQARFFSACGIFPFFFLPKTRLIVFQL